MGSLLITTPSYPMLTQVAQRVSCWAGGLANFQNNTRIQVVMSGTGRGLLIPEALFSIGPLVLEPGGADLLAGYVPGTDIVFAASNGTAAWQNPDTCAASPAQAPVINSISTNVAGDPRLITMNYANFAGAGTVNVTWGDGTVTNGAAESDPALFHTYPFQPGSFTITVTDATDAAQFTTTTITIP